MDTKLLLDDTDSTAAANSYIGDSQTKISKFTNISLHSLVKGAAEVGAVRLDDPLICEYMWDILPPTLCGIHVQVVVMVVLNL